MSLTVAELKRRIQPGVKIQSVHPGHGLTPCPPDHPFYTEVATVREVNTVGFASERPFKAGKLSHCDWPKASQLVETPDGFKIIRASNMILRYRWIA